MPINIFRRYATMAVCLLAAGVAPGADAEDDQAVGELVATLEDKRIKESSGLAISIRDPAFFWTLNDSGDEPCIFAIDRNGKTRAKVRIPGAANFDWEDIATGPDAEGNPAVFVGDIGDNLHLRPTSQIYQIPEPAISATGDGMKEEESAAPQVWHVAYPERPQNAEGLLVHPQTGQIFILTKDESGRSTLHAVPTKWEKDAALLLTKVAELQFPSRPRLGKRPSDASLATAADFSPDGTRLVIATYSHLHEWRIEPGESLELALARPALIITPPLSAQMEAVCYDTDSRTLWLTSERLPTPLYRITR